MIKEFDDDDHEDYEDEGLDNELTYEERERLFSKYPYIVAWGKILGSNQHYIEQQCIRADEENASQESVHIKDNKWVLISELPVGLQQELNDLVNK